MNVKTKNITTLILLLILLIFSTGSPQNISFNHLTTSNGLSNNKIYDIIQDRAGFIWLATDDGLNRFDGYNFKVYRHIPKDSTSISSNTIWNLFEDEEGIIWIGTKSGELNRYDPTTDKFTSWKIKSDVVNENSITSIYKDKFGKIWIGTYSSGLFRFDYKTEELMNWRNTIDNLHVITANHITSIIEHKGNLLFSTYAGLNIFDYQNFEKPTKKIYKNPANRGSIENIFWRLTTSNQFPDKVWIGAADGLLLFNSVNDSLTSIEIPNQTNLQFGSSSNNIIETEISGEKVIWIGSYAGLLRYNIDNGKFLRFTQQSNNQKSLINNFINKILKDNSGVLWVATENGLSYTTSKNSRFNNSLSASVLQYNLNELDKKNISSIARTGDGTLWFGCGDGIYYTESIDGMIKVKKLPESNGIEILSMSVSPEDKLMIGSRGSGMFFLNTNSYEMNKVVIDHPRLRLQSVNFIKTLKYDKFDNLWVGFWGLGLAKYNFVQNNWTVYQYYEDGNPEAISNNTVWSFLIDTKGRKWVGTNGGGLNLLVDEVNGKFIRWQTDKENPNSIAGNTINSIIEAEVKNKKSSSNEIILWLGTNDGLSKFIISNSNEFGDYKSVVIKNFTVSDGLSNNSINSILEDENGNLWLGTGSGISFFDVEKETFINFSNADGIIGGSINTTSAMKLDNGLMLFGSTEGLNYFHPADIKLSDFVPPIVFIDFQIFNKSALDRILVAEPSSINSSTIKLTYSENVFSFEFAALDFNSPQSIQYAYKMEGFDEDWIQSGSRRFVTYTNLSPGEYIFKIKSTNADGAWVENSTSMSVVIGSPWWATGWAYALYVIVILAGLFAIRRFEMNRQRLKNVLRMREFETNKQKELDDMKTRFFANLSHEFRTPLMLIKGPLEQLMEDKSDGKHLHRYQMIYRNTQNLQSLIDQLLELSQLESAAIPVKAKQEDVIITLKGLVYSFDSLAQDKSINLSFNSVVDSIIAWIDKDKLEKIINNLLSNAFKFTNENGRIDVNVEKIWYDSKEFIKIKVADTGIGIPKAKLEKIFDRFYQVDDSSQRAYGGSGIGLALVKELVELHRWEISVASEIGKGTEFTLKIPLWDYLNESQKLKSENIPSPELIGTKSLYLTESQQYNAEEIIDDKETNSIIINDLPSILIVEDSEDVRLYLYDLLKSDYTIYQASNGKEGISIAQEKMPDLIISDVMMPEMDGMEFCKKIKTDWLTSHIPVILLTAKASGESKIEGLETGADDYLTKPFSSKELFIRIKNLLELRKKLREKFSKDISPKPEVPALNPLDDEFIQKAFSLIEKNLDNAEFDNETFAKEMFLSRMQLHRKLQAVTGQTPGDFIRSFRMKKAAQMLKENRLSVTQIAFEVGYSSPSQFTRAFAKQFNCTPSEYLNM